MGRRTLPPPEPAQAHRAACPRTIREKHRVDRFRAVRRSVPIATVCQPGLVPSPKLQVRGLKHLNIHEAKTHLSRLVAEVEQGEQFVLCRAGRPVARLSQYHPAEPRKGGQWKGFVRISGDFDTPLPPEVARAFRGDGD